MEARSTTRNKKGREGFEVNKDQNQQPDHRQANESLQQDEAYFKSLIENSNDIITVTEMDGVIRYQSPSVKRILDYDPGEMVGKNAFDFVHPDDLPKVLDAFAQGIQNQSDSPRMEYRFQHRDGSWRILEGIGRVQIDKSDQVIGIINSRDVTSRVQMETELRESEERFRTILEDIEDGFYEVDLEGNLTFINRAYARMLGYDEHELIGMNNRQYMSPGTAKLVFQIFNQVYKSGIPKQAFDWELIRKDGERRSIEISISPIKSADASVVGFRGIVRDVTERKRAQAEIERLASFPRTNPDPVMEFNFNKRVLFINAAARAVLDMLGLTDVHAFLPADIDDLIRNKPSDAPSFVEQELFVGDRKYLATIHFTPTLRSMRLYLRDITERIQAEEALRKSESDYRGLFENVPDGIYRTTPDGQILSANPALARMLGYENEEELKEASDVGNLYLNPEDREKSIRKLEADGEILNFEIALKDRSGNILYLLENARAIRDEDGRTRYFEGVLTDITKRKQAEIELQQRKEDLELINKLNAAVNRGDSLDVLIDTLNNEVNQIYSALYCTVYLLSQDKKILSLQKLTVAPSAIKKIEQWIGQPIRKVDVPVKEGGQIHGYLQNVKGTITSDPNMIREWMTEFTESTLLSPALRSLTKKFIPQIYLLLNIGSLLTIPLISNGRTIGLLELASREMFTEYTLNRVRNISEQITTAIIRKQTEEAERDQRILAEALRETAEILNRSLDLGSVLDQILNVVGRVVPHDSATIILIENGNLHLARSRGYEKRGLSLETVMGKLSLHGLANMKEIYESRKPVLIPDVTASPNWKNFPGMEWLRSNLGAPLVIQERVIGFIFLDSEISDFFTPLHAQRLQAFADQAAIAVQNARLFEATKRQLEELTVLHGVALAGIQAGSVDELIERVTQTIGERFFPDHFGMILLDERENVLRPHPSYRGISLADLSSSLPVTRGIAGKVVTSGQSQRIGDIRHEPDYFQITAETLSELCVPIKLGERVIGVLNAESRQFNFFTEADERLLVTIAGQTAIAIENFNLLKRLQNSNLDLEKRVEERTAELNQMNVELSHANRTKDEFLANMSHELRTPLNSILGLSETLLEQRRGLLNEKQEQYMELIHSSGEHLLGLINDILEVSKIEAGKLELRPETISVKEVCESSLNFVKEMAVKKSIFIEFKNKSLISSLRADPQRLKQILVNLLSNAVKFTPENGEVSLDVRFNDEKDQIRFSVIDNGIGITQENLHKLFIPFSQIDSSLSRQYEGTGLGLALVLKLTELHGGSVMVESEPGKGSQFTIALPWSEDQSVKVGKVSASSIPVKGSDEPATIEGQPEKILLAEDNMSNVLTIQEYLSDRGFEVTVAHNGLEAIELAEKTSPDIILMDIQMPKMDGLEAIIRLRATPRSASTPIIAVTALAMPGDRERTLEAGADEYLSKPVSLKSLHQTIQAFLTAKKP